MAAKDARKPFLNFVAPVATVEVLIKLEEPISAMLERYRDFIEKRNGIRPSADDVINRALECIFSHDEAFKEFTERKRRGRGTPGRRRETEPPP